MKTKAFRKIFGTFAVLAFALGAGVAIRSASAGMETGSGWLWGGSEVADTNGGAAPNNGVLDGDESGLGWVSFNSTDCDTNNNGTIEASEVAAHPGCPAGATASYGVDIPSGNGPLSGYAWSENFGWISFNGADLSGVNPCAPVLAQATRTGSSISGGARILSIKTAMAAGNAGGFDGCISLSGAAPAYSVTVDATPDPDKLLGYAWSSDLGWIDFSRASVGGALPPPNTLKVCLNSCDSGSLNFNGGVISFNPTETRQLVSCHNSAPDCSMASGDITALGTTSFSAGDTPNDAVTPTATKGEFQANAVASTQSEDVSIVTASGNASMRFTTLYTPACSSCNDEKAQHCPTETWTSGCGVSCAAGTGTRYCDMNWKEVAPGQ
ncbi:MAG: hypothetical protein KBD19_01055 [Candidatus Moranbacteria bacterium]|nr:hypothetical protein [Candidatus Moranbacteria bacterium]